MAYSTFKTFLGKMWALICQSQNQGRSDFSLGKATETNKCLPGNLGGHFHTIHNDLNSVFKCKNKINGKLMFMTLTLLWAETCRDDRGRPDPRIDRSSRASLCSRSLPQTESSSPPDGSRRRLGRFLHCARTQKHKVRKTVCESTPLENIHHISAAFSPINYFHIPTKALTPSLHLKKPPI